MKFPNFTILLLTILLFFGCSKEEDKLPPDPVKGDLQILSFQFLADNNSSISNDVIGEINEDENKIYLSFPFNTSVTSLTPTIVITNGATITPSNNSVQDFSSSVDYVLSKEGFDNVIYSIIVTLEEEPKESDASILNFSFLKENNASLSDNYEAVIENNEIKLQISEKEDLQSIIPIVEISEGATISPTIDTGIDFRNDVVFTVTSENGELQKEYTVKIVRLRSVKDVVKFEVTIDDKAFEAIINNDLNEIRLKVPEGTDITSLTPEIQLSDKAEVSPLSGTSQNFSNPVIYTVTAEDGSEKEYTVYVVFLSPLESDRQFLEELYNVNEAYNSPSFYLDWDLEASTMQNWEGVTIVDGRVSKLVISGVSINEIPVSITALNQLKTLTISGKSLAILPPEIGSLEHLDTLTLYDNQLTSLPIEIGNLQSLKGLFLRNNLLEQLPVELGNLNNLSILEVQNNNLNKLPVEISNIPNLLLLNITNNPLTEIPQEICEMTTEGGRQITISKDTDDECK